MRCAGYSWYIQKLLSTILVTLILLVGTVATAQHPSVTASPSIDPTQAQVPNQEPQVEAQRKEIIGEIFKYRAQASEAYETMWGLLHIAILVVCIIIIRHTARVTKGARFMQSFINSYAVTACFYAGAVLIPYFLAYMANNTPTHDSVSLKELESSLLKLREIDYMWDAIDSFLSLFSSFFLIMGWHLLKRYPKEIIAREFYTVLNMIFAAIVAPLLVGVLLLRQPEVQPKSQGVIFLLVDTLAAGTAISLFGWELWRKMRPPKSRRGKSRLQKFLQKSWPWLSSPIPIIFLLWGVTQPAYIYFHDQKLSHPYFGSLLILKLLAGVSVVIAASAALDERSPYRSEGEGVNAAQPST
jgi:hypothetical protein